MKILFRENDWNRFEVLRKKVQDFHVKKYNSDVPESYYESGLDLQFYYHTYFHNTEIIEEPCVNIHLQSNILLPDRISECDWNASTFDMALYKAEQDIEKMIERQKEKEDREFFIQGNLQNQ